jgi:Flp pilus assembly protein TadG
VTQPRHRRQRLRSRLLGVLESERFRRDDRGAVAELAALLPVFILFAGLVTYAGRVGTAQADTEAAAQWAARTISASRDPEAAVANAEADAASTLEVGQAACRTMGFAPVITATQVTVTISCSVDVSDLILLPVPGSQTITGSGSEVRDQFREQGP